MIRKIQIISICLAAVLMFQTGTEAAWAAETGNFSGTTGAAAASAVSSGSTSGSTAGTSSAASVTSVRTKATKSFSLAKETLLTLGIVKSSQLTETGLKKKVSRQTFAKMLVMTSSYSDQVSSASKKTLFSDVTKNQAYIRIAVEQGWMKGNLKGKFRPTAAVTAQDAAAAVLGVLGYDTDHAWTSYKAAKLNTNISKTQKQAMTMKDIVCLLYNMLVTPASDGSIYGESLGYSLDANGDIDDTALVMENLSGPLVAEGTWQSSIPFSLSSAAVYINGKKNSLSSIEDLDVVYYHKLTKRLYVYRNQVTGILTAVSPDRYQPTSVTVGGTVYQLSERTAQNDVSFQGSIEDNDYVILLLGKDDAVVRVLPAEEYERVEGGVIVDKGEKLFDEGDSSVLKPYITVLNSSGQETDYPVEKSLYYSYFKGKAVTVTIGKNEAVIESYSKMEISGSVDSSGTGYAGYSFAANVRILEYNADGTYASVTPKRLAGIYLSSSQIYYCRMNSKKEWTDLILSGVTGDACQYGLLTEAEETAADTMGGSTIYQGSYTLLVNGQSQTKVTDYLLGLSGSSGPVTYTVDSSGTLSSMTLLNGFTVGGTTDTQVTYGSYSYLLSEDLQVYVKKDQTYYKTSFSKVKDLSLYKLTAYTDHSSAKRVRVIIAEAK